MPSGIYKRTPEIIKKLRNWGFKKGHKAFIPTFSTGWFKKGNRPWNKNKGIKGYFREYKEVVKQINEEQENINNWRSRINRV